MDTKRFLVPPGKTIKLKEYDPAYPGKSRNEGQAGGKLIAESERLTQLQEVLYADNRYALLLIFQAMDAAGKDGVIKHVMSGVNPQGCQVFSFKSPSDEELDHDFLWRCAKALPERGRIGIFNRSYYEEVLVVRVHPELLERQKLPPEIREGNIWQGRYEDINRLERHLVRNGTIIVKFFLHVSKEEQKKRFLERIETPSKNWKFSLRDVSEREQWKRYMDAYEEMLKRTSTRWAPWYIIPADRKWFTRAVVADVIVDHLKRLDLQYPKLSKTQKADLRTARKMLRGRGRS